MAYYGGCGGTIHASASGTVVADGRPYAKWGDTAIGVIIEHGPDLKTLYWHMSSEIVSVGQSVAVGDVLGYEGQTGQATGCHLHFEVLRSEHHTNPRLTLPARPGE
jgi:murein DD-endopeptidase MepM/ murein hydrolase activator NlpD